MPLAMPQPDFEAPLARHLSAFRFPAEVKPVPQVLHRLRSTRPSDEDEDADPVGNEQKFSAAQLLMV